MSHHKSYLLLQVFPTQAYDELFYAVKNSTAAGGPTYHMATYHVLSNSFQAIFGGWQVRCFFADFRRPQGLNNNYM
jgi:hypothetical protein